MDSWIYSMDLSGVVSDGGHHTFCGKGAGKNAKRVTNPKVKDIDATLSSSGGREDFAKIAPLLPQLEKKGTPYWPQDSAK